MGNFSEQTWGSFLSLVSWLGRLVQQQQAALEYRPDPPDRVRNAPLLWPRPEDQPTMEAAQNLGSFSPCA